MLNQRAFCKLNTVDQLACIDINHPKFTARISLQGAQLIHFKGANQSPLLWSSDLAEYKSGKSVRGGIPICWPWFGNLQCNPATIKNQVSPTINDQALAHGFAREQLWQVNEIKESCEQVEISLILNDNSETRKLWPNAFQLQCVFILSDQIEIQLTSTNTGTKPFSYTEALHTYLPASPIEDCYIQTIDSPTYIDTLDSWAEKTQVGRIRINEEVDRIYLNQAGYRLMTPKTCILVQSNSHNSVIWNPWIAKSQRLSQFAHNDYQHMICIENANVLNHAITLQPKASHTLSLKLQFS